MPKQLERFSEGIAQTIEELAQIKQSHQDAAYAKRLADGSVIELSSMNGAFPRLIKMEGEFSVESALEEVSKEMQNQRKLVAEIESPDLLGIRLEFIQKYLKAGQIPPLEMVFISSVVVVKLLELYLAAFLCHREHRKALQVIDEGFQGPSLPEQDPKQLFLFLHRISSEMIGDALAKPAVPGQD